ncbi:hypothetical protein [Shewanella colwelliana]|uniref:hypothetical protein n=1 Tax=Shewanella colwelliana TaxID=23 RepID=UPI003736C160
MRIFLLVFLTLIWSFYARSADISGTIKGDKLIWQSAQVTSDGLVPAAWDIPLMLPAAEKVTPGGPDMTVERTLELRGPSQSVSVPLTLTGVAYQLTSNAGVQMGSGAPATVSGTLLSVKGAGVGDKVVALSVSSSPFSHYRPIIKTIDASAWLAAFQNVKAEKGIYQGVINYLIPYDYYQNGILIRNTIQASLTVKLDHNPAQLNTVNVMGDGVIQPLYHGYPERLVSGVTQYTITADGLFPNGVFIGLKNIGSNYQLSPQSTDPQAGIKYSVECSSGCEGSTAIITDGAAMIDESLNRVKITSSNNTHAEAIIRVSFSDEKLAELNGDVYVGTFTLLFEAGF